MDETSHSSPPGAAEHALLALRTVGTALCRLLDEWNQAGAGGATEVITSCREQLRAFTGPLAGIDDVAELAPADEEQALRQRLQAAASAATPLDHLVRQAWLERNDVELLLLAALAEESALFCALFQTLGGPGTSRPTVHTALNFWAATPAERVTLQLRLCDGPLARHDLLRLTPAEAPLATRMMALPERLWQALLGSSAEDPLLEGALAHPAVPRSGPALPPGARGELERLAARLQDAPRRRVVVRGPVLSGRRESARWLTRQLGLEILEVSWPSGPPKPGWLAALARHALVRKVALVLLAPPGIDEPVTIDLQLPDALPVFLIMPERGEVLGHTMTGADRLLLSAPGVEERAELWRESLAHAALDGPDPVELARVFRLRGAEIAAVVEDARAGASLEERPQLTRADLAHAVRERPARKLEALTRRRRPQATWSDLVLPEDHVVQMKELTHRVRHRDRVFEDWGVAAHMGRQVGVAALFTGPSGTGKTLAAEVIAGELGLDLYCVDLAQTVSKYIGETEKGLARIFEAAEGSSAVLFFDEADALFGKRTETRDAHDRYANQVVSYLLTRLESFDGITILASNLRQNIDAAFLRRMDFLIEFAQPDIPARVQIWEKHLRTRVPLASNVSAQWLAEAFPISGAHIRNAVVAAAFGAAADGQALGLRHLAAAMRREFQKLGKPFPVRV
jgi:ATP-dependent 26S proteasome regulatory subunit